MKNLVFVLFMLSCSKISHEQYCGKVIGFDNTDHHGYNIDTVNGNHIAIKILFSDSLVSFRVVPKPYIDSIYCECCN